MTTPPEFGIKTGNTSIALNSEATPSTAAHFGLPISDNAAGLEVADREEMSILYDGVIRWPHSLAWYVNDPAGHEIEVALWKDDRIESG